MAVVQDGNQPCPEVAWGKPSGVESAEKKHYLSFTFKGVQYSLFDSVFLENTGGDPFLGKITDAWENKKYSQSVVDIRWFLFPHELDLTQENYPKLENKEVFMAVGTGAGVHNENEVAAILRKAKVICKSSHTENPQPSVEDLTHADNIFKAVYHVDQDRVVDIDEALADLPGVDIDEALKELPANVIFNKQEWLAVPPRKPELSPASSGGSQPVQQKMTVANGRVATCDEPMVTNGGLKRKFHAIVVDEAVNGDDLKRCNTEWEKSATDKGSPRDGRQGGPTTGSRPVKGMSVRPVNSGDVNGRAQNLGSADRMSNMATRPAEGGRSNKGDLQRSGSVRSVEIGTRAVGRQVDKPSSKAVSDMQEKFRQVGGISSERPSKGDLDSPHWTEDTNALGEKRRREDAITRKAEGAGPQMKPKLEKASSFQRKSIATNMEWGAGKIEGRGGAKRLATSANGARPRQGEHSQRERLSKLKTTNKHVPMQRKLSEALESPTLDGASRDLRPMGGVKASQRNEDLKLNGPIVSPTCGVKDDMASSPCEVGGKALHGRFHRDVRTSKGGRENVDGSQRASYMKKDGHKKLPKDIKDRMESGNTKEALGKARQQITHVGEELSPRASNPVKDERHGCGKLGNGEPTKSTRDVDNKWGNGAMEPLSKAKVEGSERVGGSGASTKIHDREKQ